MDSTNSTRALADGQNAGAAVVTADYRWPILVKLINVAYAVSERNYEAASLGAEIYNDYEPPRARDRNLNDEFVDFVRSDAAGSAKELKTILEVCRALADQIDSESKQLNRSNDQEE